MQLLSHEGMLQGLTLNSWKAMSQVARTGVGCVFIQVVVCVVAQLDLLSGPLTDVCPCLSPDKWLQRNGSVLIGRS